MALSAKEQIKVIKQGSSELVGEEELCKKLDESIKSSKPLCVKAGFDPSSPDIHLGHTVLLNKLRQFQDLGHEVVFIIGDATARVGDPSGRNKTRPILSEKEIKQNAATYKKQALKVLDPKRTKTVFNNEWFGKMGLADIMMLASKVTVQQMLHRDDFSKRIKQSAPISILEMFYPLMQAYDSVQIKADIELGGTDQKFNLLLGRELQKSFELAPQAILTLPLLVGLDGDQKMSKSLGNHIGVDDAANDMFGKVMSLSDSLMIDYYTALTDQDGSTIAEEIKSGTLHPKKAKIELAKFIVSRYHSKGEAENAEEQFNAVFASGGVPDDAPVRRLSAGEEAVSLIDLLVSTNLCASGGEARRLLKQGAVTLDGQKISDSQFALSHAENERILKVGKRKFLKLLP